MTKICIPVKNDCVQFTYIILSGHSASRARDRKTALFSLNMGYTVFSSLIKIADLPWEFIFLSQSICKADSIPHSWSVRHEWVTSIWCCHQCIAINEEKGNFKAYGSDMNLGHLFNFWRLYNNYF